MIEVLLALALAGAVPLALRHANRSLARRAVGSAATSAVLVAIAASAVGLVLPRGPGAAAATLPWLATTVVVGIVGVRDVAGRARVGSIDVPDLGILAALGFLVVGAAWLALDRAAIRPLGFATTIVLLTAVHFHVAGFVLTLAGALVARARPGRASPIALATLVAGVPLTALGFFGLPLVSWVGALLVAAAGIAIGLGEIAVARTGAATGIRGRLVAVGGATLLVTMPLAAGYATGMAFAIPFLDIPAMAAVHGALNVVGFAIPSMVGWGGLGR